MIILVIAISITCISTSCNARSATEKICMTIDSIEHTNATTISHCNDSLLLSYISQQAEVTKQMKEAVDIHIEKMDNDYTIITVWAAVLSILFLFFSFFSIYKIEDMKNEMKELTKENRKEALKQKNLLDNLYKTNKEAANDQLSELAQQISNYKDEANQYSESLQSSLMNFDSKIDSLIKKKMKVFDRDFKDTKEKYDKLMDNMTNFLELLKQNYGKE